MGKRITDKEVYPAVCITLAALLIGYLIWKYMLGQPTISQCWIYQRWDIYCPGCGGTRALIALRHGQIWKSFYYHPLVPLSALWLFVYLGSQTFQRIRQKGWALRYHPRWMGLLFCGFLVNCLVRNFLLLTYGIRI